MVDSSLPPLDAKADPKIEFFMAASHQLKSPVAIVQWCLQSILEKQDLDPTTKKLSQRALTQADAMSQMLGDMLRVFRIMHRNGGQQPALVSVDVNKLMQEILKQYEPVSASQKVRIQVGPWEQLPAVLADEAYLKQAIINVLDNALKYSPAGSSVELSAAVTKSFLEITMRDHGIGIPPAEQGRLFTEFFRGELAKEKTDNGTGLGLVLVKHILESFGGSISFTSEVGKGSVFTLKIPVQP
jgi:two-component system phosphate regulon sensor histidine kinase PhoR